MDSWPVLTTLASTLVVDPLVGPAPSFDQKSLAKSLEALTYSKVEAMHGSWSLPNGEGEEEEKSVGPYAFALSPLEGLFVFTIDPQELDAMVMSTIDQNLAVDQSTYQACKEALVAVLIHQLSRLAPFDSFTLSKVTCPETLVVGLHGLVTVKTDKFSLSCSVQVGKQLYDSWLLHWALNPCLKVDKTSAHALMLNLGLEIGSFILYADELASLEIGDWLHLEALNLRSSSSGGAAFGQGVTLLLEGVKVATAQIQEEAIALVHREEYFDRLHLT